MCMFTSQIMKYLFLLVEVCKNRKASFASKLGTPHNDRFTGCDGNIQVPWICLTHLQKQTETIHTLNTVCTIAHRNTKCKAVSTGL